jgi:hypothetical protein
MEMDERVFGELTKHIAAAPSRRGMVRAIAGGMTAAVMASLNRPAPGAAQDVGDEAICRPAGLPCSRKQQCCARKCVKGTILGQPAKVCGCWKKGHDCIRGIGLVCCSGKCGKKGKCD